MRISIFSAFYPFRGGIAQFNARLFRAFEKKKYVKVKAFTFTTQYPKLLFPGKTQVVTADDAADKIPAERIVHGFNPLTYRSAGVKINLSKPDLFIANYWMTFFGYCVSVLGKMQAKHTKRIAIIHNLIPHEERFFDKPFNRLFLKNYDAFVVLSESVEKDLVKMKPSAKFIRLAHPWYDQFGLKLDKETAQKKLGLDPNKRTLLFFGLIRDYKGLDILLEAFELLNDQYQLVIAGEVYSNADKYKQQIAKSKSKDSIFFFDRYIDDSEVSTFFSATDICVLPYRSATQSGITAIAFQFEVPCVVTNVGGLKSIVEEVGGGIAVNKVEAQSLKEGIENVFEGDKLQQMQVNLQKYKDENTWDTFAERIIEFSKTLD